MIKDERLSKIDAVKASARESAENNKGVNGSKPPASTFIQQQQAIQDLPRLFKALGKQTQSTHGLIQKQLEIMTEYANREVKTDAYEEQFVYIDAQLNQIVLESKVTNQLLARLVALGEQTSKVDVDSLDSTSEMIKNEAYRNVVNS